jgi:1-phosphofructokinase family hexose kinase
VLGKLFDRIITVSLNPALDVTLWIQTMDFAEPNKTSAEKVYAGGKAINMARVFASYGQKNVRCCGVAGENNCNVLTGLLDQDGVQYDFVKVPGDVRENLTLVIPDKRVLKINRAGCPVGTAAMHAVRDRILREIEGLGKSLLIFAGSLPPGITPEGYKAFILSMKRENVEIALDMAVFHMEDMEKLRPFVIKPNLPEFRAMCGTDLRTEQSIVKFAKVLSGSVTHVLVSLGAKGLLYVGQGSGVRLLPAPVEVRSTIGAGDTTLASFLYGLENGMEPTGAAHFAAAAGTASVTLDGTDLVTRQMVEEMLPSITVKSVKV